MRFISESILDDYTPEESNSAIRIAHDSQFSKDVHPGEYEFCVMVNWSDNFLVEDLLAVYASRFSICLLKFRSDVERVRENIRFNKFVPLQSQDNCEYAILEFDVSSRKNTLRLLLMKLMSTGNCVSYRCIKLNDSFDSVIYIEKDIIDDDNAMKFKKIFKGESLSSIDIIGISTHLYYFCINNKKKLVTDVNEEFKFIEKMIKLYKDLAKKCQNS